MKPSAATEKALRGIAKAMAELQLKKIEGYKQAKFGKKEEDEDEEGLVKVLEARAEEK